MPKLLKLNNGADTSDVLSLFIEIFSGDPERAMEAAKHLVVLPPEAVSPKPLARVLLDHEYKEWSRIASAYVLGFLPSSDSSFAALRRTVLDRSNTTRLRGHAAEALGTMQNDAAVPMLREILLDPNEPTAVRRWCIYALSEIASSASGKALDAFARTRPGGVLRAELQAVCEPCLAKVI
jgi:HEAT repeat protein